VGPRRRGYSEVGCGKPVREGQQFLKLGGEQEFLKLEKGTTSQKLRKIVRIPSPPWKSGASAPGKPPQANSGFSPPWTASSFIAKVAIRMAESPGISTALPASLHPSKGSTKKKAAL
jgi:hypothetical protein